MVAQLCKATKNHWIVLLNGQIVWYVNYISVKLLLKKTGRPGRWEEGMASAVSEAWNYMECQGSFGEREEGEEPVSGMCRG